MRIDKYLWCIRALKTRSLATEACRNGKVIVNDAECKPSKEVNIGDIIIIKNSSLTKTYQVNSILSNRVSAKLVPSYITDLTPEEEYYKFELNKKTKIIYRPKGLGRPTKKDRRDINKHTEIK